MGGSIRPTTRYLESEADGIQQWVALYVLLLDTLSLRLTEYNSGSIRPTTRYLESEADGIQQWLYASRQVAL